MDANHATRATRPVLDPVALGLLITSLVVSLGLIGRAVRAVDVPVMVGLTLGIAAYRGWLLAHPTDDRTRRIGFLAGLPVSAMLVLISPVYGLYAFIGYMEGSVLLKGRPRLFAMIATAAIAAASQMGGLRSPIASWPMYGLFVAVNVAIALLITLMERQRERMVIDLERTVAELQASEQRNAMLQRLLITHAREAGIQDERARLSREIHDTVAQGLMGIITQLEAADPDAPDLGQRLDRACVSARDSLAEARRAVLALASPRLDAAPLPDALADLTEQSGQTNGLNARFVLDGEPAPTSADADLLRITQEALSNVARHSQASRVVVTLGYSPGEVRLDIKDDGHGFDPATTPSGRGLAGMRERLKPYTGTLELETDEGTGCTVSAAVPR